MTNTRAMFEESMSSGQLLEEYRADLGDLQAQTWRFDGSEYVQKFLDKRAKQSCAALSRVFASKRGNRYLGILLYTKLGSGKQKVWCLTSYHIGLMDTPKGLCAIAFYEQSRQAIRFTPHFFQRYKERFTRFSKRNKEGAECFSDWRVRNRLSVSQTPIQVIAVYMERNAHMTWIETKSVFRDKVHIFGPVNDGVVLLQWDKRRRQLQANTFITENMLSEKQAEMVGYARTYATLSEEERKNFSFPDFIDTEQNERNLGK